MDAMRTGPMTTLQLLISAGVVVCAAMMAMDDLFVAAIVTLCVAGLMAVLATQIYPGV